MGRPDGPVIVQGNPQVPELLGASQFVQTGCFSQDRIRCMTNQQSRCGDLDRRQL
jgi:hypothetical protein